MNIFRLLLLTLLTASFALQASQRMNVLFLAADDMWPKLGCYGDPVAVTPNIDRIAGRGLLFKRAYCQQALCSPSRISLLSGRYPTTSGIYKIGLNLRSAMPDIVTLPQDFKDNGYHAKAIGKIYHNGIDDPASWSVPSDRGRKPRYGPRGSAMVDRRQEEMRRTGKPEPAKGPGKSFYAGPAFEAPDVDDHDLLDGDSASKGMEALRVIAKDPDRQPFFLAVGFNSPHIPWVAPKKYWDLYYQDKLPLPENQYAPRNAPNFAATTGSDFYWYGEVPKDRKLTEEFKRKCLHGYLAAISYVDALIGSLLDTLQETGLAKNTVVVFWSDHGYYMGEHGWWGGKHNNYEGATHAPLIFALPDGKAAGTRTSCLTDFVDIAPTPVELCGLPPADGFEGTSLVPLFDNPNTNLKEAAFSWYPKRGNLGTAMRTDRYRYVEWLNRKGEVVARELYDHQTDPQENLNIAGKPDHAELLAQLANQMRSMVTVPSAP